MTTPTPWTCPTCKIVWAPHVDSCRKCGEGGAGTAPPLPVAPPILDPAGGLIDGVYRDSAQKRIEEYRKWRDEWWKHQAERLRNLPDDFGPSITFTTTAGPTSIPEVHFWQFGREQP